MLGLFVVKSDIQPPLPFPSLCCALSNCRGRHRHKRLKGVIIESQCIAFTIHGFLLHQLNYNILACEKMSVFNGCVCVCVSGYQSECVLLHNMGVCVCQFAYFGRIITKQIVILNLMFHSRACHFWAWIQNNKNLAFLFFNIL